MGQYAVPLTTDSDVLVTELRGKLFEHVNLFVEEEALVPVDSGRTQYAARENNWRDVYPPTVEVNDVQQHAGYAVAYSSGRVQFDLGHEASDLVTASFVYSPFTDNDLRTFLRQACNLISLHVFATIDPTSLDEEIYIYPVIAGAYVIALENLSSAAPRFAYSYDLQGHRVDKRGIWAAYRDQITVAREERDRMIDSMRWRLMAEGERTTRMLKTDYD